MCQAFGCTPDKAVELLSSPRWRGITLACLEARHADKLVQDQRESTGDAEAAKRTIGKWTASDGKFWAELLKAAGREQAGMHDLS